MIFLLSLLSYGAVEFIGIAIFIIVLLLLILFFLHPPNTHADSTHTQPRFTQPLLSPLTPAHTPARTPDATHVNKGATASTLPVPATKKEIVITYLRTRHATSVPEERRGKTLRGFGSAFYFHQWLFIYLPLFPYFFIHPFVPFFFLSAVRVSEP